MRVCVALVVMLAGCQQLLGFQHPTATDAGGIISDVTLIDVSTTSACSQVGDMFVVDELNLCGYAVTMPDISLAGTMMIDTTAGNGCTGGFHPDNTNAACFVRAAGTVRIEPNAMITVTGTRPLFILADSIEIDGTLTVTAANHGPGAATFGDTFGGGGGGGGGYQTDGGGGGNADRSSGTNGGAVVDVRVHPPVIAGGYQGRSGGGSSITPSLGGTGGAGGGGVWFVAANTIHVGRAGRILANGDGGTGGGVFSSPGGTQCPFSTCGGGGGGGGGSGGYIRLAVPPMGGLISNEGAITANGGAGGEGGETANPAGANGEDGPIADYPAQGGSGGAGGNGGSGAARTPATTGYPTDRYGGGGGGGGAGWIVVHGPYQSTGITSPKEVTQ